MPQFQMSFIAPLLPEVYLCVAAVTLLMYGVFRSQVMNRTLLLGTIVVLVILMIMLSFGPGGRVLAMNGMFLSDGFTLFVKWLLLVSALLVLLLSARWLLEEGGRPFEFIILLLFSTLGMMLLVSAADIMALYMGLELMSLPLYVLAAFTRDSTRATEAGLKYFVLGALSSGMLLFGASLVYGFAGTTSFVDLARLFTHAPGEEVVVSQGVALGLIFLVVGFCFKVSAVPFHMWAPDVYEGAPTPVTAFFATAPKVAAMALFIRVMLQPFGGLTEIWHQLIVFVSVASMAVGAFGALMQTSIKRLLAYSSIGHAGFMLMGLAAGNAQGIEGVLIYLALYVFMSAGAFGCVLLMRRQGHYVEEIKELAGLSQTQPVLAFAFALFMFSMAGIPPLAGFFGKMYVVLGVVSSGQIELAVIGVLTSVIAAYYYLRVVKIMYFDEPQPRFDDGVPIGARLALGVSAIVTLFFFLLPHPLISHAKAAVQFLL